MLSELREAGAENQAIILATRAAAEVALDDRYGVALLLKELRQMGAQYQITTLLARDPASKVPLGDGMAFLLRELQSVGTDDQVAALSARMVTAGHFSEFLEHADNAARFRWGREPKGHPAEPWDWDDLS